MRFSIREVKLMPRRVSQKIKDTVRISDYADLELMEVINRVQNGTGGAKTEDISKQLFGKVTERSEVLRYANMCVTSRMNWMRRFGFVEKVEDTKGQWRLSDAGEEMRAAKIPTAFAQKIISSKDSEGLQLARQMGIRILMTKQNDVAFRAMERQLRHSVTQRKRWSK
jgi:hypothetical protein